MLSAQLDPLAPTVKAAAKARSSCTCTWGSRESASARMREDRRVFTAADRHQRLPRGGPHEREAVPTAGPGRRSLPLATASPGRQRATPVCICAGITRSDITPDGLKCIVASRTVFSAGPINHHEGETTSIRNTARQSVGHGGGGRSIAGARGGTSRRMRNSCGTPCSPQTMSRCASPTISSHIGSGRRIRPRAKPWNAENPMQRKVMSQQYRTEADRLGQPLTREAIVETPASRLGHAIRPGFREKAIALEEKRQRELAVDQMMTVTRRGSRPPLR